VTPARRSARSHPRIGPLVAGTGTEPALDVDALLDEPGQRIIVCCGAGGVGKTTTAAALGLRAAERGRKVVVLTIDPARRLAQAMGIEALDNVPRPVPGVSTGSTTGKPGGSLDAMMLDMKRTFDEVVESQASPEKAAQILANPFYVAVSSSFAGTQEYMAMEKLGQLDQDARRTGRWDLIVVDTPPSRSALDFLDAPERLAGFLDGRFMRLLLAPAKGPARLMTAGVRAGHQRADPDHRGAGAARHADVRHRVRHAVRRVPAAGTAHVRAAQADGTAFLVVAAPEPDALREAAYFVERLKEERMPLAGLVVNRASRPPRATCRRTGRWPVSSGCGHGRDVAGGRDDGRAATACTPTGCASSSARPGCAGASRRVTPTSPRPSCRRWPPMCTTSTGSARSVTCSEGQAG
jgi:anion-transporting  ArsA/GET3 family ATPase